MAADNQSLESVYHKMKSVVAKLIIMVIRAYRLILSPWLGHHCRFRPTCSIYAVEAIQRYGAYRGGWLAVKRLSRCHPWHEGGVDPVPEEPSHG